MTHEVGVQKTTSFQQQSLNNLEHTISCALEKEFVFETTLIDNSDHLAIDEKILASRRSLAFYLTILVGASIIPLIFKYLDQRFPDQKI